MVQGVLAPAQFAVFLVSLALVARFLFTGEGEAVATASVVFKTGVLYLIMVTGSIWERAVFGRYLFAPAFFWEDVVSMVVLALHTAYIAALLSGALDTHALMLLALAGLRHLRGERRAVRAEAARGPARAAELGRGRPSAGPVRERSAPGAPMRPCCASGASARCSAA